MDPLVLVDAEDWDEPDPEREDGDLQWMNEWMNEWMKKVDYSLNSDDNERPWDEY